MKRSIAIMITSCRLAARKLRVASLAAILVLTSLAGHEMSQSHAEQESPYRITEFPIRVALGWQFNPVVSGKWVVWNDDGSESESGRFSVRNIETGQNYTITTDNEVYWPVVVGGDVLIASEHTSYSQPNAPWQTGIYGYRLPDGQRIDVAPFNDQSPPFVGRGQPYTDGKTVIWVEGISSTYSIQTYDFESGRHAALPIPYYMQQNPKVSGNFVVWQDMHFSSNTRSYLATISSYDLATSKQISITTKPETIGGMEISGNILVWSTRADNAVAVKAYDIAKGQEYSVAQLPLSSFPVPVGVDGDVVVWSTRGENDQDIFGYDLNQKKQFIISRAIGDQVGPRISGKYVVWTDQRWSGASSLEWDTNIMAARLDPGPAPAPPIIGAPSAADAKVEIVWPLSNAPVSKADRANIGAWLFLSGTSRIAPCQWNPTVKLWSALNNDPAKPVVSGLKEGEHFWSAGQAIPTWDFNYIDVSAAQDPGNKIYFFVTMDNVPSQTNIWAHASDARTYYPRQDVPAGIAPVSGAVDAKIEIVWPHNNAPVDQAKQVNIGASLFSPGTLQSVPPDWNPTVRLYRALNNEVGREIAKGKKRLVQVGNLAYPVWDFDDIDVSAANDPVNK